MMIEYPQMPDEIIYRVLERLGLGGIVWLIIAVLVVLFIFGLLHERIRRVAPAVMTSVGILGTFCGIFIALYPLDFSSRDAIDAGIGTLLDGMRTAFVTSLLGIFSAIAFRIISVFWSRSPKDAEDSAPEEQRALLNKLEAIKRGITKDGKSSVVTQMQAMREENIRGYQKLDELEATIRGALVNNLATLIDTIGNVIENKLTASLDALIVEIRNVFDEKLKDSFVQFNEATQTLHKWQVEHRTQVEEHTRLFNEAAKGITAIATECEKIPPTMEKLQEVVKTAHADVEELNRQVKHFAEMRKQAGEFFPDIQSRLANIAKDLDASAASIKGLDEKIKSAFNKMRATMEDAQKESADKIATIVNNAVENFSQEIEKEIKQLTAAWGGNLVSVATEAQKAINAVKSAETER